MRLIDADRLDELDTCGYCPMDSSCNWIPRSEIDKLPTLIATPVVLGKWVGRHYVDGVLEGTNVDKCSVCGHEVVIVDPRYYIKSNYCPNCGANMKGEEK